MQNKLNLTDIKIYNRIYFFTVKKNKACFESNRELAGYFGIHYITVSKSIKKLAELGFVAISGNTNRRVIKTTQKPMNVKVKAISEKTYSKNELLAITLIAKLGTISQNAMQLLAEMLTTISQKANQSNIEEVIREVIRISKKEKTIKKDKKNKYGEFQNVFLTKAEYQKRITTYENESRLKLAIKILDEGIEEKGYKYKSHFMTLKKNGWVFNETKKQTPTEKKEDWRRVFKQENKND